TARVAAVVVLLLHPFIEDARGTPEERVAEGPGLDRLREIINDSPTIPIFNPSPSARPPTSATGTPRSTAGPCPPPPAPPPAPPGRVRPVPSQGGKAGLTPPPIHRPAAPPAPSRSPAALPGSS